MAYKIGFSPPHIPFRVFWRNFTRHSGLLIFASPPNYLLLHLDIRWPSSLQKLQFNTSTILYTGTLTFSVVYPPVATEAQTTSPPRIQTHAMTNPPLKSNLTIPKASPRLCTDWLADSFHPYWIHPSWLRSVCINIGLRSVCINIGPCMVKLQGAGH